MIQKYVMPTERVTSAAVVTAACFLGALLSNLLSPTIIAHSGWEACFFYFAAIPPLIWLPLWVYLFMGQKSDLEHEEKGDNTQMVDLLRISSSYTDSDSDSEDKNKGSKDFSLYPLLEGNGFQRESLLGSRAETDREKEKETEIVFETAVGSSKVLEPAVMIINDGHDDEDMKLSMRTLLSSPPVWAIIAAQYGQSWGMIGLLSWLPTYFTQRFHVPLESLSNFTVLPYFLQMVVAISAGFCADRLVSAGVRTLLVRQVFQIVGMLVPAVCLSYCAYTPTLEANQAAAVITLGSAVSAITVAAVSSNHFDISPKNAGTIFGIGNTAGCIGM